MVLSVRKIVPGGECGWALLPCYFVLLSVHDLDVYQRVTEYTQV
jgi:hypothetical protein